MLNTIFLYIKFPNLFHESNEASVWMIVTIYCTLQLTLQFIVLYNLGLRN